MYCERALFICTKNYTLHPSDFIACFGDTSSSDHSLLVALYSQIIPTGEQGTLWYGGCLKLIHFVHIEIFQNYISLLKKISIY